MIDCKICHKSFRSISHTHLFFKHSLTQAEYIKDFKIRTIISPETKQILSKVHMGNLNSLGRKWTPGEFKIHSKDQKKLWKNPLFREKMIRMIKSNWKTGTIREKRLKWLKGKWADPVYRKQMTEMSRRTQALPKSRKMRSRQFKKLWKTPSFLRKMARRKLTGVKSPLTEEQWKEVVGWLAVSPREFGFEAFHWNLKDVRDLILKKWDIHFHHGSIGWQFRKRGCKLVPIGPGEPPNTSNSRYWFQKWVGPKG